MIPNKSRRTARTIAPWRFAMIGAILVGAVSVWCTAAPVATAQQVQRIAAVVNDEVISFYDVSARIDLIISSSGLSNTREQRQRLVPQVLRSLIDERLEMQEAKRLNIQVTKRDLSDAVGRIEAQNNIPKGRFSDFLKQNGVSEAAAMAQIEASLAWQKLLARRVVPNIEIGEEEIDAVVARINATRDAEQFRVSEILLAVDKPADRTQVSELADKLVDQLRGGADFSAIARQFSQSATAATGGDIGWVQEGQLDDGVVKVIDKLSPGQVSEPVDTPDGLVIYKLVDRRKSAAPGEDDREIELRQIVLQLARNAPDSEVQSRLAQARDTASTKGCDAFVKASEALGVKQPADPTHVRLGDLNQKLRDIVDRLEVGQASEPIRSPVGIQVVMVCKKSELAGPPREEIRNALLRERVDLRARRYLRDLRRAAFIDVRI